MGDTKRQALMRDRDSWKKRDLKLSKGLTLVELRSGIPRQKRKSMTTVTTKILTQESWKRTGTYETGVTSVTTNMENQFPRVTRLLT